MAQSERNRAASGHQIDVSDEEVDAMWETIVTNDRRPKLERAMSAWETLGENYAALGYRVAS
jgi:hypothetical protein